MVPKLDDVLPHCYAHLFQLNSHMKRGSTSGTWILSILIWAGLIDEMGITVGACYNPPTKLKM